MRYYKQFHKRQFVPWIFLAFGVFSVYLAYDQPITYRIPFLTCAIACIGIAWILKRGQNHYLVIDDDKVIHRGFKTWTADKKDVTLVEEGKQSWTSEYDPYLKVHVGTTVYNVDPGFLVGEARIRELVEALQPRTIS
jgi:hypothetical protein